MRKHCAHLVLVDLEHDTDRLGCAWGGDDPASHIFCSTTLGRGDRGHTMTLEVRKVRAMDDQNELKSGNVDIVGVEVLLERTRPRYVRVHIEADVDTSFMCFVDLVQSGAHEAPVAPAKRLEVRNLQPCTGFVSNDQGLINRVEQPGGLVANMRAVQPTAFGGCGCELDEIIDDGGSARFVHQPG